jgi:hypothetical protein
MFEEIDSIIKKYARRLLTKLEKDGIINPVLRKHVLDEMNNLKRELSTQSNKPTDRSM